MMAPTRDLCLALRTMPIGVIRSNGRRGWTDSLGGAVIR